MWPESVADKTAVILWFCPSLNVRVARAGRFNSELALATSNSVGLLTRLYVYEVNAPKVTCAPERTVTIMLVMLAIVAALKAAELETDKPFMLLVAVHDVSTGKARLLLPVSVTLVSCKLVTAGKVIVTVLASDIVLLVNAVSNGMVKTPVPVTEIVELAIEVALGRLKVPATVKFAPLSVVSEFRVRLDPAPTLTMRANAVGSPAASIVPAVLTDSWK